MPDELKDAVRGMAHAEPLVQIGDALSKVGETVRSVVAPVMRTITGAVPTVAGRHVGPVPAQGSDTMRHTEGK